MTSKPVPRTARHSRMFLFLPSTGHLCFWLRAHQHVAWTPSRPAGNGVCPVVSVHLM